MNINTNPQTPTGSLVLVMRDAVRQFIRDFAIPAAELKADLVEIVNDELGGPDPRD